MYINIISVGNKPRPDLLGLITNYTARLPSNIKVSWTYIKHGVGGLEHSMDSEAEKILSYIKPTDLVILLDEIGDQINSEQFSERFIKPARNIVFVIGGAYGVSEKIKATANRTISLSKLVLPHQIVRLVLAEQIYRAYTISIGHPYHHS